MAFDLSTIMDGLATASGVTRAFGYPKPDIDPPCVTVEYPTQFRYDYTFHATATLGKIEAVFPVRYYVGLVVDKASRDALNPLISGAASLKLVLDSGVAGYDITNISDCVIEERTVGAAGQIYLTARFDVTVVG